MTAGANFVALAGLPRSGSTLLAAILNQNPQIHAGPESAMPELLWTFLANCQRGANEPLRLSRKQHLIPKMFHAILEAYYSDTDRPIVVDSNRQWAHPANVDMMQKFITDEPKVIVMVRPMKEVVRSWAAFEVTRGASYQTIETTLLAPNSMPIMKAHDFVRWAAQTNSPHYLFVKYERLLDSPQKELERIYQFCGWERFEHQFDSIRHLHPADDDSIGASGLHAVRPTLGRRELDYVLDKVTVDQCNALDEEIRYGSLC